MVEAMDEVAKVAERNAVAIDGVALTSQQQLDSMGEMVAASASLSELSEQLRGVLRGFETGGSAREGPAGEGA
jgi:methyl-accepting chemotaxis protein